VLTKYNSFNIINAANITSGLFKNEYITSNQQFEKFKARNLGLPILVQADQDVFDFKDSDTFSISESSLVKAIYNLSNQNYVGYRHSFRSNRFVSKIIIKEKYERYFQSIIAQNIQTFEKVNQIKKTNNRVGAFQTRNIPHKGHEKIIQKMLLHCDHLVINPVIGPKKIGDVSIEALRRIYDYLISQKYGSRVTFQPIFANMYYAGPREAVHHALLRKTLGFDLFSVGRDHAGADNAYLPEAAPNLVTQLKNKIGLDVIAHQGAAFCTSCDDVTIVGDCRHDNRSLKDISGTTFRKCLRESKIYDFADKGMQQYIYDHKMELFET
jgi:sulfate adenylyltransferase